MTEVDRGPFVRLPSRLAATCLLLAAAACKAPVQKALEAGDHLGACRAWWAEPQRYDDPAATAGLDQWVAEQTDLRLKVDRVPMGSLLARTEGGERFRLKEPMHVFRVTLTAAKLPAGARARAEEPMVRERHDAWILRPALADDRPVAKSLELALEEPPPLELEPLPAELLPAELVREESGKKAYKDGVDPARVAMGVLAGGVAWLARGTPPEPAWEPESDPKKLAALKRMSLRKRRAWEKEQARRKAEFEQARKKRADERKARDGQIEAVTARNRERVAAREAFLTARRAFAEKVALQFAPACEVTEEGALWVDPGKPCAYLTWGERKERYLVAEAFGVGMDVFVSLSAGERPCAWRMRGFVEVPRQGDGPYVEGVCEHFAEGERRLELSGAPR